jgi:hypothetical protein
VRNFYDPYFVEPNFELKDVGSKFDLDSVTADRLETFPYVITTRAAYGSGPPPDYEAVLQTDNYVLWRQRGSVRERQPAESGARPTGRLRCGGRQEEGGLAATAAGPPAVASGWAPSAALEGGGTATSVLDLRPGRWFLSLRYDATRPVTITAPGLETDLPGNLDYRGTAAFWPAGEVESDGGSVEIAASVDDPPVAGGVLGASSVAHLGALVATPASGRYTEATPPFPGAGERLRDGREACGLEADWIEVAP